MRLLVGGLLLLLVLPAAARAQDSVIVIDPDQPPGDSAVVRAGPAPDIVAELLAFYNDSTTTRMEGDVSFPPGSAFAGRLAQYRGSLRIAGRVRGDLTVINATLYLLPGADVEGDILVVGGRLIRSPGARHAGRERVTWDAAPVAPLAGGIARAAGATPAPRRARDRAHQLSDGQGADHAPACDRRHVRPHRGPADRLRARRSSCARPRRRHSGSTCAAFSGRPARAPRLSSEFGYGVRAEFRFPSGGVAGRLYSDVAPFEDQPLSAAENGWSAFLLQRDYRDWFERRGGGGSVWVQPIHSAPGRAVASARPRELAPGRGPVVPVPEQRPLAPQSAQRRRPLPHHRPPGRFRYAERSGSRRRPAGISAAGTSTRPATTSRRSRSPRP